MNANLSEEVEIENTIQKYFKGYLSAEKNLIVEAFHSETRLLSIENNKLDKTEMHEWILNLDLRKMKGDQRIAKTEVLSIDITDSAAIAKVQLNFPKYQFTDFLSLLRIEDHWKIVGKIYTVKEIDIK